MTDARTHLAWLIWCYQEGYRSPGDRAGRANWIAYDDADLHVSDAEEKHALLAMADSILAALAIERLSQ
jgi:hypothetical protein